MNQGGSGRGTRLEERGGFGGGRRGGGAGERLHAIEVKRGECVVGARGFRTRRPGGERELGHGTAGMISDVVDVRHDVRTSPPKAANASSPPSHIRRETPLMWIIRNYVFD